LETGVELSQFARFQFGTWSAYELAERRPVDVDTIRSRFIQENLRNALLARDRERAARTLRAFRLYFQWFENRVPDMEKLNIVNQLARLEEAYSAHSSQDGSAAA
jgi:hypothetical protein